MARKSLYNSLREDSKLVFSIEILIRVPTLFGASKILSVYFLLSAEQNRIDIRNLCSNSKIRLGFLVRHLDIISECNVKE